MRRDERKFRDQYISVRIHAPGLSLVTSEWFIPGSECFTKVEFFS